MKKIFKLNGFTLVELLVTVGIITVISTIGLTVFSGVQERARDSKRKSDLEKIATALELYYESNSRYPIDAITCPKTSTVLNTDEAFTRLITGELPKDPKTSLNYCYETDEEGSNFKLIAILSNNTPYELTSENFIAQAPPAAPVPPPALIPSSNDYKRVFITSNNISTGTGRYDGGIVPPNDSFNLTWVDNKCQGHADSNNLGGTWKAWISDRRDHPGGAARNRLTHFNGPYKRLDGLIVAYNWDDLTDGTLETSISLDEFMQSVPDVTEVWTGTKIEGSLETSNPSDDNTCTDWKEESSIRHARIGSAYATNFQWTAVGFTSCNRHLSLYCFEQ